MTGAGIVVRSRPPDGAGMAVVIHGVRVPVRAFIASDFLRYRRILRIGPGRRAEVVDEGRHERYLAAVATANLCRESERQGAAGVLRGRPLPFLEAGIGA